MLPQFAALKATAVDKPGIGTKRAVVQRCSATLARGDLLARADVTRPLRAYSTVASALRGRGSELRLRSPILNSKQRTRLLPALMAEASGAGSFR
jgi:hypothetical protein